MPFFALHSFTFAPGLGLAKVEAGRTFQAYRESGGERNRPVGVANTAHDAVASCGTGEAQNGRLRAEWRRQAIRQHFARAIEVGAVFRNAYRIARQFTWPMVLFRRTFGGQCSSNIASFVVVNDEGWIVTAGHNLKLVNDLSVGATDAMQVDARRDAIINDQTIDQQERRRRLSSLKKFPRNATHRWAALWGREDIRLTSAHRVEGADLGIGRLEPFDPSWVPVYPTFKNAALGLDPGVSLCKLGFPFHQINPRWDEATGGFKLPAAAMPLPLFPIEGILTRVADIAGLPGPVPPFPLRMIETSSPGLKGQSGGPIFDERGTVWGIQVHTAHYALGFDPPVPGSVRGEREHQFLNVGRGVHPETIAGMFREFGIKFQMSSY